MHIAWALRRIPLIRQRVVGLVCLLLEHIAQSFKFRENVLVKGRIIVNLLMAIV